MIRQLQEDALQNLIQNAIFKENVEAEKMQNKNVKQSPLANPKESLVKPASVALNKKRLVQILEESIAEANLGSTKGRIRSLKSTIIHGVV